MGQSRMLVNTEKIKKRRIRRRAMGIREPGESGGGGVKFEGQHLPQGIPGFLVR